LPRSRCGIISTRPWWAATSSLVSRRPCGARELSGARPNPWIHATGATPGSDWSSVAGALRFAPFRSSGFGMSCRERVVELAGAGDASRILSGPVRSGAHGPLTQPVVIPGSGPTPRAGI
jgi:hypothetical protein